MTLLARNYMDKQVNRAAARRKFPNISECLGTIIPRKNGYFFVGVRSRSMWIATSSYKQIDNEEMFGPRRIKLIIRHDLFETKNILLAIYYKQATKLGKPVTNCKKIRHGPSFYLCWHKYLLKVFGSFYARPFVWQHTLAQMILAAYMILPRRAHLQLH